jgi:N-acyl-L-homoserine lactone synthetase
VEGGLGQRPGGEVAAGLQGATRTASDQGGRVPPDGRRSAREGHEGARGAPRYDALPLEPGAAARLDAALRLRHAVFVRELRWVSGGRDGRERDRHDARAQHFVALARPAGGGGARLAGYARVLLPGQGLMLEDEFADLLGGEPPEVEAGRVFEVSRFVVRRAERGRRDAAGRGVVDHLARAIARWGLARGRIEWLSVCEVRHARALRMRGLLCERFGGVHVYQPGVPVCAIRLDLPLAAERLRVRRPADHAWYLEGGWPA